MNVWINKISNKWQKYLNPAYSELQTNFLPYNFFLSMFKIWSTKFERIMTNIFTTNVSFFNIHILEWNTIC